MSAWVAETLVATTLLMALVLIARAPVRRAFGASAAYALWLVPALRLVLPPIEGAPEPVAALVAPPVEIVFAAAVGTGEVGPWLLAAWAIGAAVFAVWHVAAYRRFLTRALGAARSEDGRGVQITFTDAVAGPAAVGLLRRRILLPVDFSSRFETAEGALAMRHEQVHHARGDLWANAAALAMLSLHWFNPLAYRAYRAFREDQELSCDAAVVAAADAETRAAYGAALVKSARGIGWATPAAPSTICPMTRSRNLKRRLKMVRTHRKSAFATAGGALTVGLATLAGLTLTATSGIAAEPAGTIKKITVKRADGPNGVADALGKEIGQKCDQAGDRFETASETRQGTDSVKTIFVTCGKGVASPADRLSTLEKVRASLATNTSMDAAQRSRVIAGLDAHIAKLKAQ